MEDLVQALGSKASRCRLDLEMWLQLLVPVCSELSQSFQKAPGTFESSGAPRPSLELQVYATQAAGRNVWTWSRFSATALSTFIWSREADVAAFTKPQMQARARIDI